MLNGVLIHPFVVHDCPNFFLAAPLAGLVTAQRHRGGKNEALFPPRRPQSLHSRRPPAGRPPPLPARRKPAASTPAQGPDARSRDPPRRPGARTGRPPPPPPPPYPDASAGQPPPPPRQAPESEGKLLYLSKETDANKGNGWRGGYTHPLDFLRESCFQPQTY